MFIFLINGGDDYKGMGLGRVVFGGGGRGGGAFLRIDILTLTLCLPSASFDQLMYGVLGGLHCARSVGSIVATPGRSPEMPPVERNSHRRSQLVR